MDQQRSLRIPISSSTGTDFVEVFPDEIPNDVNSLLDVLRAEYAPLKIWRAAALEYYHQNQLENFNEVLTEIVSAMNPEIEDYYRQRGEYEEGIVEIFDALAVSLEVNDILPMPSIIFLASKEVISICSTGFFKRDFLLCPMLGLFFIVIKQPSSQLYLSSHIKS